MNAGERDSDLLVVGGGSAGLVAAIAAARQGARVLVAERMSRVGRKLLATGNGRCNLSNRDLDPRHYHGAPADFVRAVLEAFPLQATLAFFDELGIETLQDPEGRIYPAALQASAVLDVLRDEARRLGVVEECDCRINRLQAHPDGGFRAAATNGLVFRAHRALLACGGKSSPKLGSNGGGYPLAQALGHRIRPPFPALVQLRLDSPLLKRLDGLKVQGRATLLVEDQAQRSECGELLFTARGLSGPPAFQLARLAAQPENQNKNVRIALDLFPDRDATQLAETLARRWLPRPDKSAEFALVGLLHKRLIPVLLAEAGIDNPRRPCATLQPRETQRLAHTLKHWTLPCTGTESWMHSQVTAGGVDCADVHPATLESRHAPGLYLAGELLDVDGDCGGYNLQWAWSSGHLAGAEAGRAAARD